MVAIAPSPAHITPPRFTTRQRAVLFVLLGAGFMLSADFSILNVALPRIGAGVGVSLADLPWLTSAFVLPAAGFTLVCGRLADLVGRRRTFGAGMIVLIAASLLGGLATTPALLLTARALQGFATAMTIPASMSLLTTTFTEGTARDRVLGLNGALLSGGFTVGSMLGGALVSLLSWRAAFFINIPVAVAVLLATPFVVAESGRVGSRAERIRLDLPGALTVSAGLLALVYATVERTLVVGVIGTLLLTAFWLIERRAPQPLAPPRVLRRPTVTRGNLAGLVIMAMEPAMIYLTTLYLQRDLGLSPLATGLVFGIPGLASVVAGMIAGRVIGRLGARRVLVTGMTVQALATVPLLFVGTDLTVALSILVPALFVGFFGHVPAIVAYTVTATSGLPDRDQGLATGLTSLTQQVGLTVGIPVLSAVAGLASTELTGMHLALGVDVAITLAAAALVAVALRRTRRRPAEQVPDTEQLAAA